MPFEIAWRDDPCYSSAFSLTAEKVHEILDVHARGFYEKISVLMSGLCDRTVDLSNCFDGNAGEWETLLRRINSQYGDV